MGKKSVVIVDDHPIFIQGLKIIINDYKDFHVIGEASNIQDAISLIKEQKPDLAIVDLNLGDQDGLDLIKDLKKFYPDVKPLALSMLDERYYAERALMAGARGYVMKEETSEVLKTALETISNGKIWISHDEQSRYLDALFSSGNKSKDHDPTVMIKRLTDRQLLVLRLMGKGLGTIQIAEKLNISTKTVESHKNQIKSKLNYRSSRDLLQFAIEWIRSQS